MTNQFSNLDPQNELEMQALFAKYLPIEPLPAHFAMQLKECVLAEVAIAIKPHTTRTTLLAYRLWRLNQQSWHWLITRLWLLVLAILLALWWATTFLLARFDSAQDR
jgi:hypothetical protein